MANVKANHIVRAGEARAVAPFYSHPLNPDSRISGCRLAPRTGLQRIAVNLARVPPGKESFIYHRHRMEEEWIYILEGHGQSEIEGDRTDVGPGDFLGYPRGVAHTLRNIGSTDLVYLMGGEQLDAEIAEFPTLNKRLIRIGTTVEIVDETAIKHFPASDPEPEH